MSFSEITTSENIVDCSISLSGSRIAILTAVSIEAYDWDFESKTAMAPKKIASMVFMSQERSGSNTRMRQVLVQDEDIIRLLSQSVTGESKITTYAIETSNLALVDASIGPLASKGDDGVLVRNIYVDANHQYVWSQNENGLNCLDQPQLSSSSAVLSSSEIVLVEGYEEHQSDFDNSSNHNGTDSKHAHIFSLSRKGELFANGKLLTRGCASFATTDAHLLFTTSQHLLKFVHIGAFDGRSSGLIIFR